MRPTVTQADYAEGTSSPRELSTLLSQQRRALNAVVSLTRTLQTANTNTLTTIWQDEDELPKNSSVKVTAKVYGSSADGAAYGSFEQVAQFYRADGAAAMQGSATDKHTPIRSNAAIDIEVGVSGNKLYVKVNDGGQGTLDWKLWLEARLDE